MSAITAKGLEFKKVILYKFGQDCNQSVWSLRGKGIDQRVKVEYFFNKLYVAASRATEHLFVVDSAKGDRQLWQYASDEALLQVMLQYARSKQRWQENVRTISIGTPKTVQELREDDPGAIAQEFETKGLNSQNSDFLRRAKQFYSDIGDTNKAISCEAWALKFEEQFSAAGNRFIQLGKTEEAWECFWKGMCWSELVGWYNLYPESKAVERSLALFMIASPHDLDALTHFTQFVVSDWLLVISSQQDSMPNNQQISNIQHWKKAIEEYTNRIKQLLNVPDIKPDRWQQLGEVLEALKLSGNTSLPNYSELNQLAAECFYRAENYGEAVRLWEDSDDTQTPEYNRAKAMLLGIPESLEYLAQLGQHDNIIAEWEKAGKPRTIHWLPYVASALEAKQQYQHAFVVYVWLDELIKVKECFELASQGAPPIKLITVLLQYFYRKKYWIDAIEALEKYLPKVISSEQQKSYLKFNFVYEISGSTLSPNDVAKEHRKRYKKFLKQQVLSASDWQQYLLMQQVGIALEKISSLGETLEFYERFVSHPEQELRQFAQERWIATKKKQADYARTHGQLDKAAKSHSELLKNAESWGIAHDWVPLEPPAPPKERPTPPSAESTAIPAEQFKLPTPTKFLIQGLPSGTKIEQLGDGVIRFGVRHLIVKVMRQGKQVLITDALNSREVRVDGAQCKVNIGEATVEAPGGNQLSFSLSTSGYRGNLICEAKKPRLELDVQGLSGKISIEL